jgi:hypothetical protein
VSATWIRRPLFGYRRSADAVRMEPDSEFPFVVFGEGWLRLGDRVVHHVSYGRGTVTWSEEVGGSFCAGHLFISPDSLECHGSVAVGPSGHAAEPRAVFFGALPPTNYTTSITTARQPVGTDPSTLPPSAWQPGIGFQLGYTLPPGGTVPQTYVTFDEQDLSSSVVLSTDGQDRLVLGLSASSQSSVLCLIDDSLLLECTLTFSTFGDSFAGSVTATCQDQAGTGAYLFGGQAASGLAVPASEPARDVRGSAPANLSLADLLSLVPDQSVSDESNALLVESMKWAIAQSPDESSWLGDLFGQQAPVLPASRQQLIQPDLTWYQQQLALAYLTQGLDSLTGSAAPDTHLDDSQRAALTDFLSTGLGQSTEYARQMQGLFQTAYLTAKPRLALYTADGPNWAAQLLDYVSTGEPLTSAVNRIAAARDASPVSGVTALLQALDPTGASAATYQRRLIAGVLFNTSLQTSIQDVDWTMEWLPETLSAFAARYGSGAGGDPGDQRTVVADGVQQAADYLGGFTVLAKEMAELFVQVKGGSIVRQGEEAAEAFAREYPNLSTASRAMFLIAWAGGVFSVVVAFVGWDKLSDTQKARAIDDTVGLAGNAAEAIVGLLQPKPTLPDYIEMVELSARDQSLDDLVDIGQGLAGDDDFLARGIDEVTPLFDAEARTVVAEGTIWAKVLGTAEKVVGWVGVAVAAVATVLSTIDFANDIKAGRVTQAVLDGILAAANAAMTVALVLGIVLESAAAMIAASVFAIAGLVVTIVALFLPQPKAPSPVEQFMQEHGVPFAAGLPAPTPTPA